MRVDAFSSTTESAQKLYANSHKCKTNNEKSNLEKFFMKRRPRDRDRKYTKWKLL